MNVSAAKARPVEHLERRDPVHPCGLHCYLPNPALTKPCGQLLEVARERSKMSHPL